MSQSLDRFLRLQIDQDLLNFQQVDKSEMSQAEIEIKCLKSEQFYILYTQWWAP